MLRMYSRSERLQNLDSQLCKVATEILRILEDTGTLQKQHFILRDTPLLYENTMVGKM